MNTILKMLPFLALLTLAACGPEISKKDIDIVASQIFGGEKIDKDDRLGRVTVNISNKKTRSICTGTIISEQLILTAAHCVEKASAQDLEVLFGKSIYSLFSKRREVTKFIIHESYVHTNVIANDLAIIKIAENIPDGFEKLDVTRAIDYGFTPVSEVQVAGYGLSKVDDYKSGSGSLRKTTVKIESYSPTSPLLVLNQSEERGICQGDSGGGAFIESEGELIQLGVTSFVYTKINRDGSTQADCRNKSFFTSVAFYNEWITRTMSEI